MRKAYIFSVIVSILLHLTVFSLIVLSFILKVEKKPKVIYREISFVYEQELPDKVTDKKTSLAQEQKTSAKLNSTLKKGLKKNEDTNKLNNENNKVKVPEVKTPDKVNKEAMKNVQSPLDNINKNKDKELLNDNSKTQIVNKEIMGGASGNNGIDIHPSGNMVLYGPIVNRSIIYSEIPEYPEWARKRGIESEVKMKFWVNAEGEVFNVSVTRKSGYVNLDLQAVNALNKWKFTPLTRGAAQENQWGEILVKFVLY